MSTTLLVGFAFVLLAGSVFLVRAVRSSLRSPLAADLDALLADSLEPGRGSHLDRAPTVRRLAVVAEGEHGSTYAPCIRIDLGTTDVPGMKLVFEYVARTLETIHPHVREGGDSVAYYDVEFTFGPGGLLVDGECRRVTVPVKLADRVLEDERYRAFDLQRDVERADGDAESVATLWGDCRS
jgi:hypothetical protein